jgi:hypothetical protein
LRGGSNFKDDSLIRGSAVMADWESADGRENSESADARLAPMPYFSFAIYVKKLSPNVHSFTMIA